MNPSFIPPAGLKYPSHRCTRPALTNCCSALLPVWSSQKQSGGCETDEDKSVCEKTREPESVKLWHLQPVAQTSSACDTISLSDVNVPHADLQTVALLLIWEQGMKRREHQKADRGIYCHCHCCWESLCHNCIVSSALKLLGKQVRDEGNRGKLVKDASEVWSAAYSWENNGLVVVCFQEKMRKQRDALFFMAFTWMLWRRKCHRAFCVHACFK